MKKILLLALVPFLSGCGLLFVNGPPSGWQEIQDPDQLETMAITQPCTTGKSVLLLDVAGTVIYGTTWGAFVSDQSDPMPLAERLMLPLLIPVGAHLFSALKGNQRVNDCRAFNARLLQERRGDEQASHEWLDELFPLPDLGVTGLDPVFGVPINQDH
jgi:hypothetical protein